MSSTHHATSEGTAPAEPAAKVRLMRGCVLSLGDGGVQLPPFRPHRARTLHGRGIALVSLLSANPAVLADTATTAAGALSASDDEDLREVVTALRQRGHLLAEDADVEVPVDLIDPFLAPLPARPTARQLESISFPIPRLMRLRAGILEAFDHHGAVEIGLHPREVVAAGVLAREGHLDRAFDLQAAALGVHALDREELDRLATALVDHDLATEGIHDSASEARARVEIKRAVTQFKRSRQNTVEALASFTQEEDARTERTGSRRIPVVPIQPQNQTPLALGMIIAYAKAFQGGSLGEHYTFVPSWLPNIPETNRYLESGAVCLFSNYMWSRQSNLELSAQIKVKHPANIVVHGGPDTPKYDGDVDDYFRDNDHVDIIVHGEGEETMARVLERLVGTAGAEDPDLDVLEGLEGISYRSRSGAIVRNGDRDRLTDLDAIPSPYLTGLFDMFRGGALGSAIIETNRGCPYSCTYCDWGSAIGSRIRKFSLERTFAELEWCAQNEVELIFVADANFGIFERDVAIAEKFAELKQAYGYPQVFQTNYAKNTVKHLHRIVEVLAEGGVLTEGLLSLQTMDSGTLDTIKRSNIKVEKYDQLASEFRRARLPLYVDLMLGLPGSTTRSTQEDFQQCVDREVNAKVFQTEVLVNSPMNAPEYREEFQIKTLDDVSPPEPASPGAKPRKSRKIIVSTSSFTQADYDEMVQLRSVFVLFEHYAVLRLVSRFLRQDRGIREVELMEAVRAAAQDRREEWPILALTARTVTDMGVPPVSWGLFLVAVERFLIAEFGVPPTSGLTAVFAAQLAVLPSRDRSFPYQVDLEHDVAAWHRDILTAKDAGHRTDWPTVVPPLADYGPATFVVDDANRLCQVGLGFKMLTDWHADWELDSPVSRAMVSKHVLNS